MNCNFRLENNYELELTPVSWSLRRALRKAPEYLSEHIVIEGRTIRTDLHTLWSVTQIEQLRKHRAILRLEWDLKRRFSRLFGRSGKCWRNPFYVRDYWLKTSMPRTCYLGVTGANEC